MIDNAVIFEDETGKIGEQLTNGSKKLHVFPTVGTCGIGKTFVTVYLSYLCWSCVHGKTV